jgi:adenylate cyclase
LKVSVIPSLVERQDRMRTVVARLGRVLLDAAGEQPREQSVDQLVLGGLRRYTWEQLLADSGMSTHLAERLWRAFGFAQPQADEVAFTDADRDALHRLAAAEATGLAPAEVQLSAARPIGRAMAALADWQIDALRQLMHADEDVTDAEQTRDTAERLLTLLDETQEFVWRRHLTTTAERLVAVSDGQARTMTVGFADMVGFTRTTREVSPTRLLTMVDNFQEIAHELATAHRGRIVKTIGDEVLFLTDGADDALDAAQIALGLLDECAQQPLLPELRIGIAHGPVLTHYGDVYGEPVNIAARLTAHAPPGRVLIDAPLAAQLTDQHTYRVRTRRPIKVRGYNHLACFGLTRAPCPGDTASRQS